MTAPRPPSPQQPKQLDAGTLQAEISSFALRLAAEDQLPAPMAGLQPPRVTDKLVLSRGARIR